MDTYDFFMSEGHMSLGSALSKDLMNNILDSVRASRSFNQDLFLSEEEYRANPQHRGVNPKAGRNYTENCLHLINQVEKTAAIVKPLQKILGHNYKIMDKKFVVGVPEIHMPKWVTSEVRGNRVNNMGAYIKPQYRDMTYFWGIDLHQDIIDWSDRSADFITLYIYLTDVGNNDAPLYIIPESHRFGATVFPHALTLLDRDKGLMRYDAREGKSITRPYIKLLGDAGDVNLWHACLLHGTQPTKEDQVRVSLRYLIAKDADHEGVLLDKLNAKIDGPLSLSTMRNDLNSVGEAIVKDNAINQI